MPRSTVYAARARTGSQPTGAPQTEAAQSSAQPTGAPPPKAAPETSAQPTGAPLPEGEPALPFKRLPQEALDAEKSELGGKEGECEVKTEGFQEECKETPSVHSKPESRLLSEAELLTLIQEEIQTSPFTGEGHKKIYQRLRRKGVKTSKKRILKIMRKNKLLSPHRSPKGEEKKHDGRITTDHPNEIWGTDGLRIETEEDGWIWVFAAVEHWNAECVGCHIAKIGSRFAALEPLRQGLEKYSGGTGKGAGKGIAARHDWGTQYTSNDFINQMKYWEMKQSYGYVREPETNGVAERFNRTLKEQVFYGRVYKGVEEVRKAVEEFIKKYNEEWLVEKNGYRSPLELRRLVEQSKAAA